MNQARMVAFGLSSLAVGVLAACATSVQPIDNKDLLPATALINGLKCEISAFAAANPAVPIVSKRWTIQGTLELQLMTEEKAGATIDVVVPIAGPKLGFGFDASSTDTKSRKATVDFALSLNPRADSGCIRQPDDPTRLSDGSVVVDEIGIASWLNTLMSISSQGAIFDPKKYTYCAAFGIKTQGQVSAGASGFAVVPVSLRGSALAKRDDVHILSIAIIEPGKSESPSKGRSIRVAGRSNLSAVPQIRPDISRVLARQRQLFLSD